MFSAGLYARVSTDDQQTLAMQNAIEEDSCTSASHARRRPCL
jgi:DNA invertase Pin-like site-specific DNA recombinase